MKTRRPGSKPSTVTGASVKAKRRASRGRTSRACDRCRAKKAKCDGAKACNTCRASDSPCVYSARRREARSYYCQMREVTDTAIQRLYWACRRRTGFPGSIPDESTGTVATADILKSLGLIKPEFDEFELPKDIEQSLVEADGTDQTKRPLQAIKPRDDGELNENHSVASSPSAFSSPRLSTQQVPTKTNQHSASEPAAPHEELDMKDQFLSYSPKSRPVRQQEKTNSLEEHVSFFHQADNVAEPHSVDVDNFLDVSFCTQPSSTSQSSYSNYSITSFTLPQMATSRIPQGQTYQSSPGLIYDGYLSPWPGSLVAAHHSVAT